MHESPFVMLLPLFILAFGSIFAGFIFKDIFISNSSSQIFWLDSIKFLEPLSNEHPPLRFLYLTPFLVVITIPISYFLFVKYKNVSNYILEINQPHYEFFKNKWYFDEIYNFIFVKPIA